MQQKRIIRASFKESFALIWKNRMRFLLLLILQIFFFISFFVVSSIYIPKMVESQKAIFDYLSSLNLDEASVISDIQQQKGVLGDDPLSISRNFSEIVKNFRFYLIYIFLLLIFFTSISWAMTNKLIYEISPKQLTKNFLKTSVVLLFYMGLIFSFFLSLFSISFTETAVNGMNLLANYIPFLFFSAALAYFMFVSLSLTYKIELKNIVQKTLTVGIKKMHYVLSAYFINVFLFILSIASLLYFLEKNFFILLISIMMITFSFVFGRIFLINVVEKLD